MSEVEGIFAEYLCKVRNKSLAKRRVRAKDKAISAWVEDDRLITQKGKALVIILNSNGCAWAQSGSGGCSMCGYSNETSENISAKDLIKQVEDVLLKFTKGNYQSVKLFNSGSFLDDNEIPIDAQITIMELLAKLPEVTEIIIETRPEYVTQDKIKQMKKILGKDKELELGIGLESSNDFIRVNNINKGFTFKDFKQAIKIALKNNVRVKSYLLFKPPFLTEKEAINDTVQSAIDSIIAGARSVSINPMNIQSGTLVFQLWRNDLYRSPWFWSLQKVIRKLWKRIGEENLQGKVDRIVTDPSGAGSNKGVHNCRKCNKHFIKAIKNYSLLQDTSVLVEISCKCKETWKELLLIEEATRDSSLNKVESVIDYFK
ncbi:MAG: archaeosine biosynthesis radical SAM protein RaSEA [Candidatus Heimdallarchaeota archaeon]